MPAIRAQVILKTVSNVPADYVTNSFCFDGADTHTSVTALTTALKNFYDQLRPHVGFSSIAQNLHEVKFYDLPGVKPNYPFATTTWNFGTAPVGNPYASECCVCLSFQGQKTPGFPQSRRRGRLYIGPCSDAIALAGRPVAATVTGVSTQAGLFKTAVSAITGDVKWAVWSVRDQLAVEITDGWVDNAWDIQRRRGILPTARTAFV
jgi:hypothetical protein